MSAINDAIERARAHAPFLKLLLEQGGATVETLLNASLDAALDAARRAGEGEDVAVSLRRERNAHALSLAIGDLAGLLTLEQVCGHLSDLADRALDRAIATAIGERCPGEEPRGFAAIALGKLGGRELNYSSDIDLIFLFDPATLPRRGRDDPGQAAVRIGQRVLELLQQRTADGYVFRVDLRLRPSPEVTPIALSIGAAISHYETSALAWERSAFIRSRHAAGDAALGRSFLDAIHPFIWRRSLDFGAINEILAVSHQVRDHYSEGQLFGPGYDLKRGRGGIREIEFYSQAHQLIHGGRETELRTPATLDALAALAAAGRVAPADAERLSAAYRLLRTIEHRVQMVDDRQTHQLPAAAEALDNVARLHGLPGADALLALIEPHVQAVSRLYDGLAPEERPGLPHESRPLQARLAGLDFPEPATAAARIGGWRSGRARSLRTPAAREAFEALLPLLIEAFARAPDPVRALNRFDTMVERLPSGLNFFRLLEARPRLTAALADILSHAPALADQLGRRPDLFDGLIDASALAPVGSVAELAEAFGEQERPDDDYQLLLDRVRARVNGARFALGAQLVLGCADPLDVSRGYARVAQAAVQVLAAAAVQDFAAKYGVVPGAELLILGLGRLGGGQLTHASDLDLVYLFTGDADGQSDGAKALRPNDYFNRLAPRVTAALSVSTAAGPLYDIDLRLRPSGRDGMLAVSTASFADYQGSQAWTFEHMALTRARPVFGSPAGRAQLADTVATVLRRPRQAAEVIADAARMRADIARHKPPRGAFDLKQGEGGLIDLEFLVHALQLIHHVGLDPDLDVALTALAAAGLVPPELIDAHRLLTRMLVTLRLVSPQSDEPPPASRQLVANACGLDDWAGLLEAQERARAQVTRAWRALVAAGGS